MCRHQGCDYWRPVAKILAVAYFGAGMPVRSYGADPPDVLAQTTCNIGSPLTLKQIYDRGAANYKPAATDALSNLNNNVDLSTQLKAEASKAKHVSELTLRRIAAIESRCDLRYAYSKDNFKGYFQMGEQACKDVGLKLSHISDPSQWRNGCEAGRLYLDLNWDRLAGNGAVLRDGDKATLTALYLMHQQGPAAGAQLWKHLCDGSAANTAASAAMRANVGPEALENIEGDGPHEMQELEFYAYWVGALDIVIGTIR
jgi:hypothetical protein